MDVCHPPVQQWPFSRNMSSRSMAASARSSRCAPKAWPRSTRWWRTTRLGIHNQRQENRSCRRISSCSTRPCPMSRLVAAMVQARDAVETRSWLHPQEPTTEEWWADCWPIRARESRNGAATTRPSKRSIASPTSCGIPSSSPATLLLRRCPVACRATEASEQHQKDAPAGGGCAGASDIRA